MGEQDLTQMCPRYERAVSLLGQRWTPLIIRALLSGANRFGAIRAYIREMSDPMLSERLKQLEAEGVVERRVHPETPVRIEYLLTEKGRALLPVVEAIQDWASAWVDPRAETAGTPGR